MLVEWKQIQEILIPKIEEYDRKYPPMPPGEISPENRFLYEEGIEVTKGVDHRVNLPFHQKVCIYIVLYFLKVFSDIYDTSIDKS
jgi:hypothetical protein